MYIFFSDKTCVQIWLTDDKIGLKYIFFLKMHQNHYKMSKFFFLKRKKLDRTHETHELNNVKKMF